MSSFTRVLRPKHRRLRDGAFGSARRKQTLTKINFGKAIATLNRLKA